MEEHSKHGKVEKAAMRSGMDRKTARKYLREGKLPSQMEVPRKWRTREDPFIEDWEEVVERLREAPELEAKALFEDLTGHRPERYEPGQLRTFQRLVRKWRAQEGPPKEVFFPQQHLPGEAMQSDFTCANELRITIAGEPFPHLLCHPVLPYSNWEWATVCRSESMAALRRGVQAAVFQLGRVPQWHQTDNSTAATHKLEPGKRAFNAEYLALMRHLGMKPRTIGVGKSHQNGDVEALNGALKRRLHQHLLLRGSRDFESVEAYERWVQEVLSKANRLREKRLREELETMRPLCVKRLPEWKEEEVRVASWSTIRVKGNTYSVPSRLVGERVRVRIYDDRLEVYHAGCYQMTMERLLGKGGQRIDYRHLIWSLVRKPGAFCRYRYREELFPSLVFRKAYDVLSEGRSQWRGDMEYLRILHLAASTMEAEVETALGLLLEKGEVPEAEKVKELVLGPRPSQVPQLAVPQVELAHYDALLQSGEVA